MALRGNLKDFSLPDVFQLVTLSRKTGILRIRRGDGAEGSVWFREGDVFFAQSNWNREPLGERLVGADKITPSALARALEAQRTEGEGGRRLGQILVDEGYITDKVLEAFVQEQIQDTIFDLFRWDEGAFDFEPLASTPDEDIGLSVSIENIVMEGSRRLEEWNRIKKKIPSMEIVFKMATAPGEGTFEISLKPVEWNLLLLIDGTRSVAEIATATGRTDFDVSRILYGLYSAGLLEVASDDEVEKLRAERERLGTRVAVPKEKPKPAEKPVEKPAAPHRPSKLRAVPGQKPASEPQQVEQAPHVEPAKPAEAERPAEPEREPEVPTFLSGEVKEPSAEDMAVFEQMMGAVLQAPPPTAPAMPQASAEAEPEPEPEPEPAEEPQPELEPAPEPEPRPEPIEETLPEPEPIEEPAPPLEEIVAEPMSERVSEALPEEQPVEPVAEEQPSIEPEPELEIEISASDFFTSEETVVFAPEEQAPPESLTVTAEQVSFEDVAQPEPTEEERIVPLPSVEGIEIIEPGIEDTEVVDVTIVPEPSAEEQPAEEAAWLSGEGADDDLADLLSSLRQEGEDEVAVEETTVVAAEEEPEPESDEEATVISTDAFLSDFDDMGGQPFAGGLGDELTALTGAGSGRTRSPAGPTPAPAADERSLRRDTMVDKDVVMKVIEGIKGL
jgi:hypothetical protein